LESDMPKLGKTLPLGIWRLVMNNDGMHEVFAPQKLDALHFGV